MTGRPELGAPARLGLFVVGLAVAGLAAAGVGALTGDVRPAVAAEHASGGHGAAGTDTGDGTSLSAGGLRLDVPVTTLPPAQATPFSFTVREADGTPVRSFDLEQDRRLHLVIVDRELRRYAHLHPDLAPDGTWSTLVKLSPGSYRAVADFSHDGMREALAVDLVAPGAVQARDLPPAADHVDVDGFTVALRRTGGQVAFAVDRAGAPARLEPYLGAAGHLVAFRAGDLAYSHVHPAAPDAPVFDAAFPTPGRYRLFFSFSVAGVVHTAAFTVEA